MFKYYIYTLGCKVNSCDSNDISNNLLNLGFSMDTPENANIIIVNSCAVTSESVRKARQNISKFKRINKNVFLILTGCASILDEFKDNKNVDLISDRNSIIKNIKSRFVTSNMSNNIFNFSDLKNKTRFFMKIEDGCENFCSYCIIPFTRGKIKSKKLDEIEYECKNISNLGFKEIILTGINLGKYGKDLKVNLLDAIQIVRKYFSRIRLSSLEPDTINDDLIDYLSSFSEICPHFHLSLQSGSNRILERMNRKYDIEFYFDLIEKIRNKFNNVTFATDLIVGFPDENEDDFEKSIDAIRKVKFIKVNVFPFSPRPFTLAEKLKPIDGELKKYRVKKSIEIAEEISKNEISKFFGNKFNVLFETKELDSDNKFIYSGYSENYIKIRKKSDEDLCNKIQEVIFIPYSS